MRDGPTDIQIDPPIACTDRRERKRRQHEQTEKQTNSEGKREIPVPAMECPHRRATGSNQSIRECLCAPGFRPTLLLPSRCLSRMGASWQTEQQATEITPLRSKILFTKIYRHGWPSWYSRQAQTLWIKGLVFDSQQWPFVEVLSRPFSQSTLRLCVIDKWKWVRYEQINR